MCVYMVEAIDGARFGKWSMRYQVMKDNAGSNAFFLVSKSGKSVPVDAILRQNVDSFGFKGFTTIYKIIRYAYKFLFCIVATKSRSVTERRSSGLTPLCSF